MSVHPVQLIESASAGVRLTAALRFVETRAPAAERVIVAATRDAADEFVRELSRRHGATFGLHRFSFRQLVARVAAHKLAERRLAPITRLGAEAIAARATFDTLQHAALRYVTPVARSRGFPRALTATVADLRLSSVDPQALSAFGDLGFDLQLLAASYAAELERAGLADWTELLGLATDSIRQRSHDLAGLPVLLLDVALETHAEVAFVSALIEVADGLAATVPTGDERTLSALRAVMAPPHARPLPRNGGEGARRGGAGERQDLDDGSPPELARIRRYLFALDVPSAASQDGAVHDAARFFSAPGESRECVEIVRRVLEEAASGVRFDEMAVLVRAPSVYAGLLESALRRGNVPAWFARGTSLPHPAGRAFLALLACAAEGLSASRFAEYLSLGQVPALPDSGEPLPTSEPRWVPADAVEQPIPESAAAAAARGSGQRSLFDVLASEIEGPGSEGGGRASGIEDRRSGAAPLSPGPRSPSSKVDSDDAPVLEGTLRAPWKWERLLVESSVIGGGYERWDRRLNGLARELEIKLEELRAEEPEAPRLRWLERDLADLRHLRGFALPAIRALVDLPVEARWGEWIGALGRLGPMVLRRPDRVLAVLAELAPMAGVGPVRLNEVQRVLLERLAQVREDPPPERYGKLFVGTPDQARGRQFRVVFLPGLAERIFPQRPHDDPLLLDEVRCRLNEHALVAPPTMPGAGPPRAAAALGTSVARQASMLLGLPRLEDRATYERLRLRLAVGVATERLYLSYPRMDVTESRPRVPSFYALDIARALTGRVPDFDELEREAYEAGGARLAWPAPADPARAIDDTEHDLAVLGRLLRDETGDRRGRARYLFELDPTLGRALRTRYMRWERKWSRADGLYKPDGAAYAALQAHRLRARPYSVSALQKFAVCPYQFLLSAIYRLEPRKEMAPLERLDPLTRGHLFHRVQAELIRQLQRRNATPVTADTVAAAEQLLDRTLESVEKTYRDELVPAIDRVWQDEIESIRADLRAWLRRVADEGGQWNPIHTEFGFGFRPGEGRDAASVPDPVLLGSKWKLHGIVDLIERRSDGDLLRITDHKTGKVRAKDGVIVGGGEVLQPVLYAMAVEQALGRPVAQSRLFYCTAAGNFTERAVAIDGGARRHGLAVLEIIDRAIEDGVLPPAPKERACIWCEFRSVCGPWEYRRIARKPDGPLADLKALREMP